MFEFQRPWIGNLDQLQAVAKDEHHRLHLRVVVGVVGREQ